MTDPAIRAALETANDALWHSIDGNVTKRNVAAAVAAFLRALGGDITGCIQVEASTTWRADPRGFHALAAVIEKAARDE